MIGFAKESRQSIIMRKLRLLTAVFLVLGPMLAMADHFLLEATSNEPTIGDFAVLFEDTGDGLLEWDEVVSFSGINIPGFSVFDDLLLAVPTIAGISSFSSDPDAPYVFVPNDSSWSFTESADLGHFEFIFVGTFTYAVSSVPEPSTFYDVPTDHWAYSFIETLAENDITSGCGDGVYCPEDPVTRAQMAVFLERGMNGGSFSPPVATGNVFLDVGASDFAANFIEQLFLDGITSGCAINNYCPDAEVTRAQMAVFLLKAKYGAHYVPSPQVCVLIYPPMCGFSDVDSSYFSAAWIEQLAAEGITSGCGNGNFCPNDPVTRAQMAVFLVRTFDL